MVFWNLVFERKSNEKSDANQGSWILGGGWNNDLWGGELPMASWVDDITPSNPVSHNQMNFGCFDSFHNSVFISLIYIILQVWLSRMDGHMGLANSVALKLAGITTSSEDPNGGKIVRFTSGGII